MNSDGANGASGPGADRVTRFRTLRILGLLAVLAVGIGWLVNLGRDEREPQPAVVPVNLPADMLADMAVGEPADMLAVGLEFYGLQCAACHGDDGLGDGTAAYLLYPKPRNFSGGKFLLTSTEAGLPSDEDLLKVLRNGMPGSAMPPWGHLPDPVLNALVQAIRHLALEGKVAELTADGFLSEVDAREIAHELLDSGPLVELPPMPAEIDLALGHEVYAETCALCHDEDGRGRERRDMRDEEGYPSFARDFTQGIFKGSADDEALATRLIRGLPGSPMPGEDLTPEQLWATVRHVQAMIEPGAGDRVRQERQTLGVQRIARSVPEAPDNSAWNEVPGTFLSVMPLWWRHERIEGVTMRAVHDGTKVAIRLEWEDATQDDHLLEPTAFSDAVAIQLFPGADLPQFTMDLPLFTMGDANSAVQIWHWQAASQRAVDNGWLALNDLYPNLSDSDQDAYPGVPQDEFFLTGAGAGNPVSAVDPPSAVGNVHARGFGTLTHQGAAAQDIHSRAARGEGSWQVVFVRDLETGRAEDVQLHPGQTFPIAFAVWDGSAGDRGGQKAMTIWHRLQLDP